MTDDNTPENHTPKQPNQADTSATETKAEASSEQPVAEKTPKVAASAPASVQDRIAKGTAEKNSDSGRPEAKQKPLKVKAKLGWGAKLLLLLAFLLALAAAAAVGYLVYQQQQTKLADLEERQALSRERQGQIGKLAELEQQLKSLTQQAKQDREVLKGANQSREVLSSRMATLEKEITVITGSHRIDWMLREVEHFINVAEQRLSLLGDARGALALMLEAEDIVRSMQEPTSRPLRQAMVKDIHELKLASETSIDVDGLFLRLSDLANRVESLGIPSYELVQRPKDIEVSVSGDKKGIELFMDRFTDFLGSLFRYQKHAKSQPLLLTSQRDYLAQSIILLLNQAQLALLQRDNEAYHLSLNEVKERVRAYIRLHTPETQFFIGEISELASVQLRPKVPSIEGSSRAVRVFREFWNKEKLIREQQAMALKQEKAE